MEGHDLYNNPVVAVPPDVLDQVARAEGEAGTIESPVFTEQLSGPGLPREVRRCTGCAAIIRSVARLCPACGRDLLGRDPVSVGPAGGLYQAPPWPPDHGPGSASIRPRESRAASIGEVAGWLGLACGIVGALMGFVRLGPNKLVTTPATARAVFAIPPLLGVLAVAFAAIGRFRGRAAIAAGFGAFVLITWIFGLAGSAIP